jgi:hypothetical protein
LLSVPLAAEVLPPLNISYHEPLTFKQTGSNTKNGEEGDTEEEAKISNLPFGPISHFVLDPFGKMTLLSIKLPNLV